MAIEYSVFMKKTSIEEVKEKLEVLLNSSLQEDTEVDWELYRTILLGLEVSLFEATDYEDDGELLLTQYDCQINVGYTYALDWQIGEKWAREFSLVLGILMSKELNQECIVVKDVQVLIEQFLP